MIRVSSDSAMGVEVCFVVVLGARHSARDCSIDMGIVSVHHLLLKVKLCPLDHVGSMCPFLDEEETLVTCSSKPRQDSGHFPQGRGPGPAASRRLLQ